MRLLFRIRGYTNGVECGTIGNNADYSPQFHRFASKYGRLKMWIWLNWALSNAADMWANFFDWKFIQKSRTAPSAELLLPHRTFQNFTKASLWIQIFVRIEKKITSQCSSHQLAWTLTHIVTFLIQHRMQKYHHGLQLYKRYKRHMDSYACPDLST